MANNNQNNQDNYRQLFTGNQTNQSQNRETPSATQGRNIPYPSGYHQTQYQRPTTQTSNQERPRNNFSGVGKANRLLYFIENAPLYAVAFASWVWSIFKSIMIVMGIISVNLADSGMGALALSLIFNTKIVEYTNMSDMVLSIAFSLGLSAVQIYMWMLINKRGIGLSHLFHWSRIPRDVKSFLGVAFVLWVIDTFMDTVPLEVILTSENFSNPMYFGFIKISVYVITIVLCGCAELITGNMKKMLEG